MFARQEAHHANSHGLNSLKRGREEESSDLTGGGPLSFTEHRDKRLHTLPLRGGPALGSWSLPSTTSLGSLPLHAPHARTPSDTDSEDAAAQSGPYSQQQPRSHFSPWSSSPTDSGAVQERAAAQLVGQNASAPDADMDMMMDSVEEATPPYSHEAPGGGGSLEPGSFHPDSVGTSITGRMPTPILPSFAAQVRGNNWSGAAGNVMQAGQNAENPQYVGDAEGFTASPGGVNTNMVSSPIRDRTVPRSLEHPSAMMADWNMVQNRTLPSPISESGGEDMSSPDMVLDCAPSNVAPFPPQRASSAMELPMYLRDCSPSAAETMEGSCYPAAALPSSPPQEHPNLQQYAQHQRQSSPGGGGSSPSPKKGHTRSRHTVNNWTQNLGMKKSFSIGYRADCEKCRLKVPGHFNHIIVS